MKPMPGIIESCIKAGTSIDVVSQATHVIHNIQDLLFSSLSSGSHNKENLSFF
jgi:hypothetical protein